MKERINKYGFVFVFTIIGIALAAILYMFVKNGIIDFDGAVEAIAAKYFADTGRYASVVYGQVTSMDMGLSTGPTIVLPVALIFKIFGVSFANALIVSALYLFAFLFVLFEIGKQYFNKWFALLFAVIFFATPTLFVYGIGMIGEVPATLFILLSVLAWAKLSNKSKHHIQWAILLGVCIYLSFLTKIICVFALVAFVMMLFGDLIFFKSIDQKDYKWIIMGAFVSVVAYEIFKFIQFGWNFHAYKHWFRLALNAIVGLNVRSPQAQEIHFTLKLFLDRTNVLITNSNSRLYIIAILLAFPAYVLYLFVKGIIKRVKGGKFSGIFKSISFPLITTGFGGYIFIIYWYFICQDGFLWYRRILPGILLLTIFTSWLIIHIISNTIALLKNQKRAVAFKAVAVVISIFLVAAGTPVFYKGMKAINVPMKQSELKTAFLNDINFINNLPKNAVLYGVGFWQSPHVSLLTGRPIRDINVDITNNVYPKSTGGYYVLVDIYYYNLDQSWKSLDSNLYLTKVYDSDGFIVYRMDALGYRPGVK